MSKPSVIVEGLSKKFGLSLKSALKYGLTDSFRRLTGRGKNENLRPSEFWALKDVSFTLEPGDTLGIMGVNGSGKTTLLRILNGSYSPDAGRVTMRGRIGALIAAGAGFSPLLTGRENVFISGTLLGMHPSEIRKKFDEIVAFADLEEFIDMPIRNYSSGMSVRLGFAVAVLGTPKILLVDEVLAVGDIAFQKKCYERIHALKNEGTTILLVSHTPGAIWAVCNKGFVLHQGISRGVVSTEDACRLYDHNNLLARAEAVQPKEKWEQEKTQIPTDYGGSSGGTNEIFVTNVDVLNAEQKPNKQIAYGEPFILRCYITSAASLYDCMLRVQVDAEINKTITIIDSYEMHKVLYNFSPGKYIIDIHVKNPRYRPGVYFFSPSITKRQVGVHLFYRFNMAKIVIVHPQDVFFYADFRASYQVEAEYITVSRPSKYLLEA